MFFFSNEILTYLKYIQILVYQAPLFQLSLQQWYVQWRQCDSRLGRGRVCTVPPQFSPPV